tara:strand:- start:278 stop:583 length:306 start_codon:yes stop_codon:yes gene_type:complete
MDKHSKFADRLLVLPDQSKFRVVGIRPTPDGDRGAMVEVEVGHTFSNPALFFLGKEADAERQTRAFAAGSVSGFGYEDVGEAPPAFADLLDQCFQPVGDLS